MVARGDRCSACGGPLELSPEPQWQSLTRRTLRGALPRARRSRPDRGPAGD